jgi:N-acetylneuraminate synthase
MDHQQMARENARRSLVVNRSIRSGEIITADHITAKRPAHGICPSAIGNVLNRKAAYDLEKDTILDWEHIGAAER